MSKYLHIFIILNVFFFYSNQISKSNTRSQECYIITKKNNKTLEGTNLEFFSSSTLSSFLPHFLLLFFSLLSNFGSPLFSFPPSSSSSLLFSSSLFFFSLQPPLSFLFYFILAPYVSLFSFFGSLFLFFFFYLFLSFFLYFILH